MFRLIFFLIYFLNFLPPVQTYNPIPNGAVVVTTQSSVIVVRTQEYGGADQIDTIYQAPTGMIILNSVLDSTARSISIIYQNLTNNNTVCLSPLISRQQLSSIVYELNVNFTNSLLITPDVSRNRAFGTYSDGRVTLFSLSGLLETMLNFPTNLKNIQLAAFNPSNNRLFIITKQNLYSCANLDTNQLQCCQASISLNSPRWITFDPANAYVQCNVLDASGTFYRFQLDANGCPTDVSSQQLTTRSSLQIAVDQQFIYAAASSTNNQDNSYLFIRNPNIRSDRFISVGSRIVALQVAYATPSTASISPASCFYGITYGDYRTAVILAAIFGTIMGILMCFNVLFCIDFFMTKSVIRGLKSQIPHDLLEDRWNKLVEEKYAKLALEKARKRDDPPPPPPQFRRSSSATNRRNASTSETSETKTAPSLTTDSRHGFPNISDYIRRKSESYLSRRRSDDYRIQSNNNEITIISNNPVVRQQIRATPAHIETVEEENETRSLRKNLSGRELLNSEPDLL